MSKSTEVNLHVHIHEGASPEAVRAAVEAIREQDGSEGDKHRQQQDGEQATELIRQAYLDSEEKAKPLLEYLADNAGREIPYPEMSEYLGFPTSRSLPGLLGAFSRRADHRYGGLQPFERRYRSSGWHLYMSPENAELINELRKD